MRIPITTIAVILFGASAVLGRAQPKNRGFWGLSLGSVNLGLSFDHPQEMTAE
mgnify:CR=1 FL=1